jgi:FkbM family methyltransferase
MDSNDIKVIEFLRQFINENDVLVDVGANNGDYTEFFKHQLNGTGKIYSLELHPKTFLNLKNKFSNDLNVMCFNVAVSNEDGECTYFSGKDSFTHNIIGHDMDYKPNSSLGTIKSIRLDTLLNDETEIDLIKIDVEGAEYLVLEGISGIINKTKHILVECHLDEDWEKIRKKLIDEYNLNCTNVISGEIITPYSNRAYQCFCKK